MALSCQVSLNVASYAVGQTPPPMATVTVYNPNASAVVVSAIQMTAKALGNTNAGNVSMPPSVAPIGPGATTTVPALSSINIGPFPVVVNSAANANGFQAVNQTGNIFPLNPQGSQPPQFTVLLGADVYGSDGSFNAAGIAPLLVSYTPAPPLGFQGGYLLFAAPNNLVAAVMAGVI